MNLKKNGILIAILSAIHLTGCGGGSDSNSSQQPAQVADRPSTDTPPVSVEPNFSLTTYKSSACGSEPVVADIVYHSIDGRFISTEKTSPSGEIASTLPENTQHVSLVYNTMSENGEKQLQIQTLLNVSEGFKIDTFSFNDKEPCGCSAIKYDLTTLKAQTPNSTVFNVAPTPITLSEAQTQLSTCSTQAQTLVFTQSETDYQGGVLDTSKAATITLSDQQLTASGILVDLNDRQFDDQETIHFSSYLGNDEVHSVIVNQAAYTHPSYKDKNQLVIFNDLETVNYLSLNRPHHTQLTDDLSFTSYFTAMSRVSDQGKVSELAHIQLNDVLTSAYESFINSLNDETQTTVLDFSAVDHRVNLVTVNYAWDNDLQGKVNWQIITDGEETIPHLLFGDVVTDVEPNNLSVTLSLSALNTEHTFDDLRATYLNSMISFEKRVESKLFDNMANYSLTHKL
ncbi:hypothetical protein [Pseudoalteromonas luteoviolacea]|uniref:Uncharacterized protein n=1 Tax=Pseudoalteromonas luteoviolacea S4054 TaxID=1129367 RepID=A0A0F6AII8_9GAMM|nr:hypothetical protein [Pseudoalteromonas luteoviolacea]AOT11037.1 hypothetical protein S4054249_24695 [Pseudoalteromonas luteoviolacea]AOT15799.1 hypothetical protein S40542_23815 [Pseudoalteromonas luteoviolacea]AOT20858.1 hypothetical protein S4054_24615 [Pseudoalteromonas luteoviolacea]KKE85766.1 hypothetical protein N479_24740 [Pseudoalteromonas luteoviolacea S4054]KZN71125.1 hypothetical protein N481_19795 [Pseudoalteromonas luteoviolacea S4047-1]